MQLIEMYIMEIKSHIQTRPKIKKKICRVDHNIINRLIQSMYYKKGVCNADTRQGIFRKKSNASRSRLSINQNRQSSSCPSSPRQGLRLNNSTSSLSQLDGNVPSTSSSLHRSASTMSAIRPRSSPSGLFSYTGI